MIFRTPRRKRRLHGCAVRSKVESVTDSHVLVVGSANMDLVVATERFPAAGETLLGGGFHTSPGGKGANQAAAIGRLEGKVRFLGKVGPDAFGSELVSSLRASGVDTELVLTADATPSGIAVITVDAKGQNTIIVAPGSNGLLDPDDLISALDEPYGVVLTQLEIPLPTVEALAARRRPGSTFILNPAPAQPLPSSLLAHVTFITPNETEAELLTGIAPVDPNACFAAACRLFDQGVENVVITLGAAGCFHATPAGGCVYPTLSVRPVDTTAAGDAFNGALAHFLAGGAEVERALLLANCVGALATTKPGAVASMPSRADLEAVADQLLK